MLLSEARLIGKRETFNRFTNLYAVNCFSFLSFRHVHIVENNKADDFTDEGLMKYQLKLIQLIKLDLQWAVEFYNKLFIK